MGDSVAESVRLVYRLTLERKLNGGTPLRIALLEPYYGGSHRTFCDAIVKHSCHDVTLVTMPARKWKWRMRGAAMWFAYEDTSWFETRPDVILCNDMLSVCDLRALLPASMRGVLIVCYFHENQLSYPIPDDQVRDFQYGMTNITSALSADAVWFNSRFHLEDFVAAAGGLLGKMPDFVPSGVCEAIRAKSRVLYPPVEMPPLGACREAGQPLTILWPHRWEFDKNPEPFFAAVIQLAKEGLPFRLVVLGEQFRTAPRVFEDSWGALSEHIHHAGYVESREAYLEKLGSCDVVVSTAIQENFGIAAVEAMVAGCQPLFPDRLAYAELLPGAIASRCLYARDDDLVGALRDLISGDGLLDSEALSGLRDSVFDRFGAERGFFAIDVAVG